MLISHCLMFVFHYPTTVHYSQMLYFHCPSVGSKKWVSEWGIFVLRAITDVLKNCTGETLNLLTGAESSTNVGFPLSVFHGPVSVFHSPMSTFHCPMLVFLSPSVSHWTMSGIKFPNEDFSLSNVVKCQFPKVKWWFSIVRCCFLSPFASTQGAGAFVVDFGGVNRWAYPI